MNDTVADVRPGWRFRVELSDDEVTNGTVVEVRQDEFGFPEFLGLLDDERPIRLNDDDAWWLVAEEPEDRLPYDYIQIGAGHPVAGGCPGCWACARTAAELAHQLGHDHGGMDCDTGAGHTAAVRKRSPKPEAG